jgi:hypothetical protein
MRTGVAIKPPTTIGTISKTGSIFVYILFVNVGEECSNNLCVTAVDTPFWARMEQNE